MIYLLLAAKKLISLSQWSGDKQDDAGVAFKQRFLIFNWGNEEYSNCMFHQMDYLIPLMLVNKSESIFVTFVDTHSRQFMNNICLLQDEVYEEGPLMEKEIELNQQFGDIPLPHKPGSIGNGSVMKCISEGTSIIVVVVNGFRT